MSYSTRPALRAALYIFNFGVVASLLAAAFFLSQGLFGDLYSCNERTAGEIIRTYDLAAQPIWALPVCLVDLNYTATTLDGEVEEFYALQVTIPCTRILEDGNETTTTLCYNRYHPEYFATIPGGDEFATDYTHDEALRDRQLGYKAALWMALFGFLASGLHRHMDAIDKNLGRLQDAGVRAMKCAGARCRLRGFDRRFSWACWRRRAQEDAVRESELQNLPARSEV